MLGRDCASSARTRCVSVCFHGCGLALDNDEFIHVVPVCYCTGEARPMKFKQRKGKWCGPKQRLEGNLPRGEWDPDGTSLRYEFVCPDGMCPNRTTRPWTDPRIHTVLPHTGEGYQASLRRVLLRQRNIVESHYAALQRLGLQGRGVERPAWANDVEVHWMLALGATFLTARRLVFESGLYDEVLSECQGLRLLDDAGRRCPAPGPTVRELAAATTTRNRRLGPPAPPELGAHPQRQDRAIHRLRCRLGDGLGLPGHNLSRLGPH